MQKSLIKRISSILPVLKNKSSKGNNGRIAIIGGSYQFTGAPFYSAISALKSGADLAHIFCSKSSSTSIKAYSPEIIVHPVFVSEQEKKYDKSELPRVYEQWLEKIRSWEKAIHCWVIGPGLGRDPYMNQFFPILIRNIGRNKVVIFDADGIYYLAQHPELFGYLKHCKTIITPNSKQLSFIKPYLNFNADLQLDFTTDSNPQNPEQPPSLQICPSAFISPSASRPPFSSSSPLTPSPFSSSSPPSPSSPSSSYQQIQQLPNKYRHLHNFTLLLKGEQDIILGSSSYIVRTQGGPKRCGGIGDILAGVCSACSLWNFQLGPVLASRIVRKATNFAYQKQGRSMTAPSIVKQLSRAIRQIQNQNK